MSALLAPQLARAQAPGSLTPLASPNNCVEATGSASSECSTKASGLTGTENVAVSPDGDNVYSIGFNDSAITEFRRNADGSLTEIGCVADHTNGAGTCSQNATATGLVDPRAIAVSPDNQNVYVAAGSSSNGDVAEFTRGADGTLTQISGHDCIAENSTPGCNDVGGHGLEFPNDLAVYGQNVYVADQVGKAVTELVRAADGSLSEPDGAADCIEDASASGSECSNTGTGLSDVTTVVVSPLGDNVYTAGAPNLSSNGSIAEFARSSAGALTQFASPDNCIGTPEPNQTCGSAAAGLGGAVGLVVSPDGDNVYAASQFESGPIAEFSRGAGGALAQLASPNDCISEQGFGCGSAAVGIGSGFELAVSQDGQNVYAAAPTSFCSSGNGCADVAELARNAGGALTELSSPDSCIQDASAHGNECPGNENGTGLGGAGIAVSPDGNNVYVTGTDSIAEFARGTHAMTVSVSGSGSGAVSDGTGAIACPSTCSNAYTTDTTVTLTATPTSGSTFAGWSGACTGTGPCQVIMNADNAVSATFSGGPGTPGPVVTGTPSAVTDSGAGFQGSVNPEGLATTVYFEYGLDKRYSQVGASGPSYTARTPSQPIAADFTDHSVGPVTVSGLVPDALYHLRLVATNSAGTAFGQDVTFKTSPAPVPTAPALGQSFNLAPVSGVVQVLIHGHLVPLTQLRQLPAGVAIDSRHGTFQLITATGTGGTARDAASKGKRGKTQTGKFGGAVVRIHQLTSGPNRGMTTVMMVLSAFKGAPSQAICNARGAADAQTARSRVIQLLHASAHGKFSTSGRYSAATVRGTNWTMTARCDGTLVHDITDSVVVTDFVLHRTIILNAGQSYLAPGP
ncbi:MAG: hypothetical protein JO027_16035 [Solirubrobacterales bacterium]|nr:hypothetical protein [Solirubrobacterales bacterium]